MSDSGNEAPRLPIHRPLGWTFYGYVAREALRPTVFALIGLTVVVLTKDLLGFSNLVINRGLSLHTVGLIALFKAVPIAALMFPFSVLLGCLVAMGRLGADGEILTLESSGVAAARLVWPVIVFAGAMTVFSVALSVQAAPWAARSLDAALDRVALEKPWAHLQQGVVSEFGGWQIEAREVSSGGDRLKSVLMWMPDIGETIFARSGRFETSDDGSIRIHLEKGSVALSPSGGAKEIRFDALTTTLPSTDDPWRREAETRLHGLSMLDLGRRALTFIRSEEESLPRAAIELQRRMATPAATLVFGFLAAPLFLIRGNFSRSSGGIIGLLLTIGYYGLVQLGEGLIQSERVMVATGVWMPNAVLMLLGLVLLVIALRGNVLGHSFDRSRGFDPKDRAGELISEYRPRRYPLPRYIAGRFAQLGLLTFAVLVVAYLLIDVMERLDWFARYHATGTTVIRFYGARIPLLASRVVPMALLVASALTVSLLAAEGELIGMRSCGIPAFRALLPVLLITSLVAPAYFGLNNVVVPRTNALADELKVSEIKEGYYAALAESRKQAVWYRSRDQVLEAERFDPKRGIARNLKVYRIGDDGLPVSRLDARSARHIGAGVWRLVRPEFMTLADGKVRVSEAPRYAVLGEALPAEVDTMHLSVASLAREIEEVEADGHDATHLRVDRQMKLAEPLACIVLPAVLLFFAVGGPPFPGPAQNLLVSGIVGVSYILLTGVSASFGYRGNLPPAIGGWGPNIVFSLTAAYFGARLWRRM
ncbi:MAG: LptF/LptG family permease [Myxococcota bacterium]